jgi:hypothetical protein
MSKLACNVVCGSICPKVALVLLKVISVLTVHLAKLVLLVSVRGSSKCSWFCDVTKKTKVRKHTVASQGESIGDAVKLILLRWRATARSRTRRRNQVVAWRAPDSRAGAPGHCCSRTARPQPGPRRLRAAGYAPTPSRTTSTSSGGSLRSSRRP